jgi:hypothetical protein
LGHTVYYMADIQRWEEFKAFLEKVCSGLGLGFSDNEDSVLIEPECPLVEPLELTRRGEGFVKTNLVEPCHSIYLLILHSVSSFGSVSIWED